MSTFSRFFGMVVAVIFIPHTVASAATLYMDPVEAEMSPGDTIAVAVRIDTDLDECINVVDGVITFPENIIPVDISLGNSILPVWVEDPIIDLQNNRITFAGGIPNGYCGRIEGDPRLTNTIAEIIFQAPGMQIGVADLNPVAQIEFAPETNVLLNDGEGTPAQLRTVGAAVLVNTKPSGNITDEWRARVAEDTTPPNPFTITLNSDPSAYAGRYFVAFNTTDKQSGIDHYQIIEEPLEQFNLFAWGGVDAPWVRARSPYLLEDQSLNSTIRVRAFDKAGNQYVATLVPDESLRGKSMRDHVVFALAITGVLVLLIGFVLAFWLFRRKKKKQQLQEEEELVSEDENNEMYEYDEE